MDLTSLGHERTASCDALASAIPTRGGVVFYGLVAFSRRSDRRTRRTKLGAMERGVCLRFLGTGASGGTPGSGRSRRLESSLVVDDGAAILLDVTRDFSRQSRDLQEIDAILLTHAHRDACGGFAQLRSWWRARSAPPIPVYASVETIAALQRRYAMLDHCHFIAVCDGERHSLGGWTIKALTVPHALERRHPTFAWRLRAGPIALVYASDVARPTSGLRRFCRGAEVLAIDAALWRRRIFSHLTIDEALPELCRWPVEQILLTHIGKTLPPHEQLEHEVAKLCPRARPAFDGMTVGL
jgi:phosphoribosyl 1,2-cyclic phosphodiesterase